jgi:hemoglobin
MKAVHEGLQIRDEHFDALVEDLVKALNEARVSQAAQDRLLSVLGPMRADIVER